MPVTHRVGSSLQAVNDLSKKDSELLQGFDKTLKIAQSNSEKGLLNIEMGKA